MDSQNTPPIQSATNSDKNIGYAPEKLPILENKKVITHTMKEDMAIAQGQGGKTPGDELTRSQKPFAADIPSPPLPPASRSIDESRAQDTFREPIDDISMERDQPISIPGAEGQDPPQKQFKIYIPQKKSDFNITTIILVAVLVVLIAGGGFGYYWFFIKDAGAPAPTVQTPTPPAPEPEPRPIAPIPEPEPIPQIQPEPIPSPATTTPPIVATTTAPIIIATTTPPIIIATSTAPIITPTTSTPPIITEPTMPSAVLALDQDIIIKIAKIDKTQALEKIKSANSKIINIKSAIRYAFELSNDKEKRFLTAQETAQMFNLTIPQEFWQLNDGFDFIGYKSGKLMRYGLVAKAKNNKDQVKSFAGKWEPTILDDLKSLYVEKSYNKPKTVVFLENTYLDFYKRYVNMPLPDISFDYAVSDKYFAVATSKEMIYAILDKTKSPALNTAPTATSTQEIILGK